MLCESNLSFSYQFGPHDVDVGHLVVNFGPLGVDFKSLESPQGVDFGPRGVYLFPRGVDFRPLGVNFWFLSVGFGPL